MEDWQGDRHLLIHLRQHERGAIRMKVELHLSTEEYLAAYRCLERRYQECRRKIREGDRMGRGIQRYRDESILLARVLEEFQLNQKRNDPRGR